MSSYLVVLNTLIQLANSSSNCLCDPQLAAMGCTGAYVMSSSLSEVGGEGIGVTTGVGFAESIGVAVVDATGGTLK